MWLRRFFQLLTVLLLVAAIALAYHRFHRTPAELELRQYVEFEVPGLTAAEAPIRQGIASLLRAPGLSITQARQLLVDDLMPRLVALHKMSNPRFARSPDVQQLKAEYTAIIDRLIESCRRCIHLIDDPKADGAKQFRHFQDELQAVTEAFTAWSHHVQVVYQRKRR